MSAPTPAPGDDRPREGYYPDPSIPGYVRYWNGAAWVPGTSRPAPTDGELLAPPPGVRPADPAVEETGPHFFDEDPQPAPAPGDRGAAAPEGPTPGSAGQAGTGPGSARAWPEPASSWSADRSQQSGFGGEQDRRVSWGAAPGADPRVPADGRPTADGTRTPGAGGAQGSAATPGTPGAVGTPGSDGTPGSAPASGDAPADGTFVFRRPTGGAGAGQGTPGASAGGGGGRPGAGRDSDEGTITFRAVSPRGGTPSAPSAQGPQVGPGAAAKGPQGAAGFGAPGSGGAGDRAAGTQTPGGAAGVAATPLSGPQRSTPASAPPAATAAAPGVPHQAAAPQPTPGHQSAPAHQPAAAGAPAPLATPLTTGPGGGQASWAQQVHHLAGAADGEQPVAPWKPPVEDVFQAAARRQAAARPAGLGRRLAARLIDTLVLGAVTSAAAVPLGTKAADHINEKIDAARLSGREVTVWLVDGTTGVYLGIVLAVLLVAGVLCEALPTARWGRTLGKKLLGLEVRDIEAHEAPAFGAALRRWLVYSVPGLLAVGVIGVVWGLFDRPWHQCWHDKAAHTFVAG
ncbi:RDD family protein [Streptomyces sp. NPDC014006]|uniref:RDD family protein n=1 Tax=Streptomyces sp. NPDC014006 TaxID=3364870 RepID=UPI0036FDECC1